MSQLTIQHAIAASLAQDGMDLALDNTEKVTPTWGDMAVDYIRRYAKRHPVFAGWMIVKAAACDPNFPAPESEKAWGQPIKRAAKAGIIKRDGYTKDPNRHNNDIPKWKSLVYEP